MSNPVTFIAYIDESGDEGFKFGQGSSTWFVLGAAVYRKATELNEVKVVNIVRDRLNAERLPQHRQPKRKPLHFRDMRHEQKKFYVSEIAKSNVAVFAVLIAKPDLTSPEIFQTESHLYHYAVRLLVERISWYCRDHYKKDDVGDGSVSIIFSNRATMDYDKLRDYLRHLEANHIALGYRAAERIIRPDLVESYEAGKRMGLQVADAIAASFFFAVEPSGYGLTESGYGQLLMPRAYRHEGQVWGYGLKVVPSEAEEKRRSKQIMPEWQ